MEKEHPSRTALKLALAAVFAALVFVATYSFVVYIPITGGYFNLGEAVIYTAALFFGPLVGAFAGGVGAMVADLIVAPVFAPGTLIVKAVEGTLVGFLAKKLIAQTSKPSWRVCTVLLGLAVGITF